MSECVVYTGPCSLSKIISAPTFSSTIDELMLLVEAQEALIKTLEESVLMRRKLNHHRKKKRNGRK